MTAALLSTTTTARHRAPARRRAVGDRLPAPPDGRRPRRVRRAQHARAGGPGCPDRSRRRSCLRRRGRDGTAGAARPRRAGRQPVVDRRAVPRRGRPVPLRRCAARPQRRARRSSPGSSCASPEPGRHHYPRPVHCPVCHADDTKVVDSRLAEEGAAVRRRRHCLSCAHRFTTFERVDEVPLVVVKGDGRTPAVRPVQDRRRHHRRHQGPQRRPRASSSRSPSRSRTPCGCRARRSPAPRSAWPCSTGCARSTRSPTSASPASTRTSTPPPTSTGRSSCSPRPPADLTLTVARPAAVEERRLVGGRGGPA